MTALRELIATVTYHREANGVVTSRTVTTDAYRGELGFDPNLKIEASDRPLILMREDMEGNVEPADRLGKLTTRMVSDTRLMKRVEPPEPKPLDPKTAEIFAKIRRRKDGGGANA